MKQFLFAATAAILPMFSGMGAAGDIVIPEDNTPFKIKEGDIVRVPVNAVTGAQVNARVSTSSQVNVHAVTNRVKGKAPPGTEKQEVEVKPKVKGKITLYVTVSLPNGKETTEKYEFEVE